MVLSPRPSPLAPVGANTGKWDRHIDAPHSWLPGTRRKTLAPAGPSRSCPSGAFWPHPASPSCRGDLLPQCPDRRHQLHRLHLLVQLRGGPDYARELVVVQHLSMLRVADTWSVANSCCVHGHIELVGCRGGAGPIGSVRDVLSGEPPLSSTDVGALFGLRGDSSSPSDLDAICQFVLRCHAQAVRIAWPSSCFWPPTGRHAPQGSRACVGERLRGLPRPFSSRRKSGSKSGARASRTARLRLICGPRDVSNPDP